MANHKELSLLIPCYGGNEPIKETLKKIPFDEIVKLNFKLKILVIATPDEQGDIPDEDQLKDIWESTKIIIENRKGYGQAYISGFSHVTTDYVVTADADGTYPVDKLPTILNEKIINNYDFVSISRMKKSTNGAFSKRNKLGNHLLTFGTNLLFLTNISDSQSGMWLLNKNALNEIEFSNLGLGMEFSTLIKLEAIRNENIKFGEIDLPFYRRISNEPQLRWFKDGLRIMMKIIEYRYRSLISKNHYKTENGKNVNNKHKNFEIDEENGIKMEKKN